MGQCPKFSRFLILEAPLISCVSYQLFWILAYLGSHSIACDLIHFCLDPLCFSDTVQNFIVKYLFWIPFIFLNSFLFGILSASFIFGVKYFIVGVILRCDEVHHFFGQYVFWIQYVVLHSFIFVVSFSNFLFVVIYNLSCIKYCLIWQDLICNTFLLGSYHIVFYLGLPSCFSWVPFCFSML